MTPSNITQKQLDSLIKEARKQFGDITPVTGNETDSNGVSVFKDCFVFWFNDNMGSTHVIKEKICN